MYNFFKVSLLLLQLLICSAFSENSIQQSKKIYVPSDNVILEDKNIFVILDQECFKVSSISSDDQGIYIEHGQICGFIFVCKKCGRAYDPDEQYYLCPHHRIKYIK